ncbi:hypothetical protein NIA69_01075 [Gemmiger formicilis]|nr:hypothetical protein [Gemmiger formicilis]
MQDDAARVKNLCYYLKEGDWDKSLAALDTVLTGWRRAGSVKGGKDANQCASAASQLRDRAKDQMTSLQRTCCSARRRSLPQTAAALRRWWPRWCGRPRRLPTAALRLSAPKRCWTTRIMST